MRIEKSITCFFEDYDLPLYIWGAGNSGYWLGCYLNKCSYEYEGYIDKKIGNVDGREYYEQSGRKRIIHPSQLKDIVHGAVRVIIASQSADEILRDISNLDCGQIDITVLYPYYRDVTEPDREVYNINEVLAYFRRKLITNPVPSIISNCCSAGFVYRMIGLGKSESKSPTISSIIMAEDYMKVVNNPQKYLSTKVVFSHWTTYWGTVMPVGKIDDVQVFFIHDRNESEPIRRWNSLIENIDFSNLFFLFEDHMYRIPDKEKRAFLKTEYPHLMILTNDSFGEFTGRDDVLFTHNMHFHIRGLAIENHLDMLEMFHLTD